MNRGKVMTQTPVMENLNSGLGATTKRILLVQLGNIVTLGYHTKTNQFGFQTKLNFDKVSEDLQNRFFWPLFILIGSVIILLTYPQLIATLNLDLFTCFAIILALVVIGWVIPVFSNIVDFRETNVQFSSDCLAPEDIAGEDIHSIYQQINQARNIILRYKAPKTQGGIDRPANIRASVSPTAIKNNVPAVNPILSNQITPPSNRTQVMVNQQQNQQFVDMSKKRNLR